MTRYAARNAVLPPLTGFAPFIGQAVGGLIVIELIFSYPGVGFTLQQAALGHDYALAQGFLLLIAGFVLIANFVMDCLYVFLDPRVRKG
jgi:peptide/nickel transport system permease protein